MLIIKRYVDPRDLLSFPTRRSSDLCDDAPGARRHRLLHRSTGGRRRDRKSTRLNSSHTVTSYAVFCWKTKSRSRFIWTGAGRSFARLENYGLVSLIRTPMLVLAWVK